MALLQRIRRSQLPMTRVIAALFVTGWLGFAVQPCVAMDHGADGAHAGHHDLAKRDADPHCPHCPPVPDPGAGCDPGVATGCDGAAAPVLPSKDFGTKQPNPVLLCIFAEYRHPSLGTLDAPCRQPDTVRPRPAVASLQQQFCSFLK